MKICILINDLNNRAGTERSATLIANSLAEHGYDVSILSFVDVVEPGYKINDKIKIINLGVKCKNNKTGYIKIVKAIRSLVIKEKFDVFIEAEVYNRLFTTLAMRGTKTKVITWEHFNFFVTLNRKERKFARWLAAKYSDAIVTLTEKDKLNYLNNLKCTAIVENIANTLVYYPERFSNLESKKVLAVGRFNYQKGFDVLIEVWNKSKMKDRGWILEIVGDGEEKTKIEDLIKKYNLSNSIKLSPATNKIEEKYLEANLYAMTSRFEGFPMVLIEALSFGLPVVSFDCQTGPSELIKDGENGYLIEDKDIDTFAERLNIISEDSQILKQMGLYARESIKNLDIKYISEKWINLLERIK